MTYHQLGLVLDELRAVSRDLAEYHRAVGRAERDRLDMHELILGHIGQFEANADLRRDNIKVHVTTTIADWRKTA